MWDNYTISIHTKKDQQQGEIWWECAALSETLLSSFFFDPDTDLICSNRQGLLVLI